MAVEGINLSPAQIYSPRKLGFSFVLRKSKVADWLHHFIIFSSLVIFLLIFTVALAKFEYKHSPSPLSRSFTGFLSTLVAPFSAQKAIDIQLEAKTTQSIVKILDR